MILTFDRWVLYIINGSVCDPGFLVGPYLAVYGMTIVVVFLLLGSKNEKRGIIKFITNHKIKNIIIKTLIYMVISGYV